MASTATQDYLKTIYQLCLDADAANTSSIAERLGVRAASVTGMLKRLADRGLIEHVPYYGATLTSEGRQEAVRMVRRHRVLELFLVEVLGYTWDRVHDEAETLEHAASDELIDRMARILGEPRTDPHGDPIPGGDAEFVEDAWGSLADLAAGRRAVVRRVSDEDPAVLRYLAGMDLRPGAGIEVLEHAPFDGPVRLRVNGAAEQVLGRGLARSIGVEPMDPQREERTR
ncbi:MAG: metal-dependent transcriptional regulator [Longimicrobiales bacterium]